ncbi:MAG: hypothetical protein AAF702_24100 [Chloroflexota bacterium]
MYSVRPFNPTDQEYEIGVALSALANPNTRPSTVDQWKETSDTWDANYHYQRFVIERNSADETKEIVAVGTIFEAFWSHTSGEYTFWINVHPDFAERAVFRLIYDHMVNSVANRTPKPTKLLTVSSENLTAKIQFLLDQGFEQTQHLSKLGLAVPDFDHAPHAGEEEKLAAEGICIYTLSQLEKLDSDWKEKLYQLRIMLEEEESGIGSTSLTLPQFEENYLQDPALDPEAWWVAIDTRTASEQNIGTYIGYSNLWLNDEARQRLDSGMTGVLRRYPVQQIGKLLILKGIEYGQRHGSEQIVTNDDEHSPFVDVNEELGFKHLIGAVRFAKTV